MVCQASNAIWAIPVDGKADNADALIKIVANEGVTHLGYTCTLHCDNCGSMKMDEYAANKLGLSFEPCPPGFQSINHAESAIGHIMSTASTHMANNPFIPVELFKDIVFEACYIHNRNVSAARGGRSPYDILGKGLQNDGSYLAPWRGYDVPIGTCGAIRKTTRNEKPPGILAEGFNFDPLRSNKGLVCVFISHMDMWDLSGSTHKVWRPNIQTCKKLRVSVNVELSNLSMNNLIIIRTSCMMESPIIA